MLMLTSVVVFVCLLMLAGIYYKHAIVFCIPQQYTVNHEDLNRHWG